MKICPYCQTQNPDGAVLCTECMQSIGDVVPVREDGAESVVNEFFEKEEKRDKLKAFLWQLPILLYYVIYIPLYILTVKKDSELFGVMLLPLLFGGLYYLLVFKAEFLFKFNHMFDIDNIDEVHVSDMYVFSSKISGVVMLVAGLVMAVYVCWDVYDVETIDDNSIVLVTSSVDGTVSEAVMVGYRFENSGFPTDEDLKAYGAVFADADTGDSIKSAFDVFYENYSKHIPANLLFVMDEMVYELVFDGDFMYLFKDEYSNDMRKITTLYPEKLTKGESGYTLLGDGNTALLEIDF